MTQSVGVGVVIPVQLTVSVPPAATPTGLADTLGPAATVNALLVASRVNELFENSRSS